MIDPRMLTTRWRAEWAVHRQRWRQPGARPRVLIAPSFDRSSGPARLRAWDIGEALREIGWRSVIMPHLLGTRQRQRIIRLERPDVVLIQRVGHALARPGFYHPIPVVFDCDDADWIWPENTQPMIECARDSRAIIAGSRFIADWFKQYNNDVTVIWTGTGVPSHPPRVPSARRGRIVAWGHSSPKNYPLECKFVQETILACAKHGARFEFWLYGVREPAWGELFLAPIKQAGIQTRVIGYLSYEEFLSSLEEVAVGLHPTCPENEFSRGKSFGKVLAYMASRAAVVTSTDVDHALFFTDHVNAILADDPETVARGIIELLDDPAKRQRLTDQAFIDFAKRLSTRAAAAAVDGVLRRAAGLPPLPSHAPAI